MILVDIVCRPGTYGEVGVRKETEVQCHTVVGVPIESLLLRPGTVPECGERPPVTG